MGLNSQLGQLTFLDPRSLMAPCSHSVRISYYWQKKLQDILHNLKDFHYNNLLYYYYNSKT